MPSWEMLLRLAAGVGFGVVIGLELSLEPAVSSVGWTVREHAGSEQNP